MLPNSTKYRANTGENKIQDIKMIIPDTIFTFLCDTRDLALCGILTPIARSTQISTSDQAETVFDTLKIKYKILHDHFDAPKQEHQTRPELT